LILLYEHNIQTSHIPLMNNLISKEAVLELKIKLEFILNQLSDKIKLIENFYEKKNIFDRYINFDLAEIFQKVTSFKILELTSELLTKILILYTRLNPEKNMNVKNNEYLSNQQYIVYFFELLV
jgi:hypothetical protein